MHESASGGCRRARERGVGKERDSLAWITLGDASARCPSAPECEGARERGGRVGGSEGERGQSARERGREGAEWEGAREREAPPSLGGVPFTPPAACRPAQRAPRRRSRSPLPLDTRGRRRLLGLLEGVQLVRALQVTHDTPLRHRCEIVARFYAAGEEIMASVRLSTCVLGGNFLWF